MREPAPSTVALSVRTVDGRPFRRGGRLFARLPVSVPLSSITPAQASAILSEPALVVEEVIEADVSDIPEVAAPIPEIIPSPEPSTPPAPEPIPSGEGSSSTVVVVNVKDAVASPEAVAANIAAALPQPAPVPPPPVVADPPRRGKRRK